MKAIVPAAGRGEKIFPYELTRQKAAMPIGNTYLIRWTVQCLHNAGIQEITVVVGYLQERVRHALIDSDVRYVQQGGHQGTAWAVLDGLEDAESDEPLLVVYGDCLFGERVLSNFIEAVNDAEPFAAAMLSPLKDEDSRNWICGELDGDHLSGISGHPRSGSHRLCGLYYLSPQAIRYVGGNPGVVESVNVGGMPKMEAELAQSIQMMIDDGHSVMATECDGLFVDIDKPWHILEANQRFASYLCGRLHEDDIDPSATVSDGADISGFVKLGPDCRIGDRVVIKGNLIAGPGTSITNGAMIGGNCLLGANVKCRDYCLVGGECVVRDESIIGHGAELSGVLFEGVYLYHYCEMAGIFGAHHDVGAATVCGTLRFDDDVTPHVVRGRTERPRRGANVCYFGDYTRTGVNAIIMPGVKVGAYSCIGPGVVQYEDVDHKTLVLVKQDTIEKQWGANRYGW